MHLKFSNQRGGGQEKNHLKGLEGIVAVFTQNWEQELLLSAD